MYNILDGEGQMDGATVRAFVRHENVSSCLRKVIPCGKKMKIRYTPFSHPSNIEYWGSNWVMGLKCNELIHLSISK